MYDSDHFEFEFLLEFGGKFELTSLTSLIGWTSFAILTSFDGIALNFEFEFWREIWIDQIDHSHTFNHIWQYFNKIDFGGKFEFWLVIINDQIDWSYRIDQSENFNHNLSFWWEIGIECEI